METNLHNWLMDHQPSEEMTYEKPFWYTYCFLRDYILNIFYPETEYRLHEVWVQTVNENHSIIGTHCSKSIIHPVIRLDYKGCTIVFRYNFHDYEIAVISPKDIYFHDEKKLLHDIFHSKKDSFFYQGFPDEYRIDGRYEDNKKEFMAKVYKSYEFYYFMYALKLAIDAENEPVIDQEKGIYKNPEMDNLRKKFCLCFNCEKCKPNHTDHCKIAAEGYALCKKYNIAFMVTRCKNFKKRKEV